MEMSYKQLEKTLLGCFKILPDRESTFRSRIKQLQRLEFPSGVNVGRGTKMTYSGVHLFKMVSAFELIGAGLPAKAATQIVEDNWPTFAAAFGLSAIQKRWSAAKAEVPLFLNLEIRSMFEIQIFRGWRAPTLANVAIQDELWIRKFLNVGGTKERSSLLMLLNTSDLVSKIVDTATNHAGVKCGYWDDDFVEWLPKETSVQVMMKSAYPDRSNIKMRQRLHRFTGGDPDSLTEEGLLEAKEWAQHVLMPVPF